MSISQELFDTHCLDEVFSLTQNMLRAAQLGDWKQVADMEMVRCSLLPHGLPFSETTKEKLTTILQLNSEINNLANMKLITIASLWDNALHAQRTKNIEENNFHKNTIAIV